MRVARRRMVKALRDFIAFITCSQEKEVVEPSEKDVDESVSLCMKWKRSSGSVAKLAKMLVSLRDMIAAEVEERYGKHIARTHGEFLKETLPGLCKFKEVPVQTAALDLLYTLGLSDDAATYLATTDMFKFCITSAKSKNKLISVAATAALTTLVNHEDTRYSASDEGLDKSVTNLINDSALGVRAKRNCVVVFARLADDPEVASLMSAKNPEQLLKTFLDFVDKTNDTDTEKWALISIARLALNDEFSDLMAKKGHIPHVFELSRDKIPARKLAAALIIANMARNKNLREMLVKYRAIQLFCTIAMNTSERVDMAEMQLVAALGLKNLASNFELRALAGKTGAIAACIFMMKSQQAEVQRYAALAISELALYEPNGVKFCKGGVLKWIIRLARSGDVRSETAAITALSNLLMSPENQATMIAEDGTKLVDFLTNSRNPRVAHIAKTLLKRLRIAKLRTACKFAARLKATGNALIEQGVTIGEPDSGES